MTYKTIFSGRLEFGTPRSYEKVLKLFEHRVENYYRSDVLLNGEEIFNEEAYALDIPRHIASEVSEKTWRNTVKLLEYVTQYAVAGDLGAWKLDNGRIVEHMLVEPTGDKAAVQAYLEGRKLVKESGMESEAKKALSRAIEKFERHALAYERRGYVNFQLRNFDDAIYDYNKSIDINPSKAEPYFGRAHVRLAREEWAGANKDLEKSIKLSIPLQPIYWKSRRLKAENHLRLEEFEAAATELKFFTRRTFKADDPNFKWRKRAFYNYGKCLFEIKDYKAAVEAFSQAAKIDTGEGAPSDAELLLCRGMALKESGQNGFVKDWKEAADKGSEKAAELLQASS